MDLAQCQDPCFPLPTQCTLNNISFSQQGPPGLVFVFLPQCTGSVSTDGSHHGSVGTLLTPTATDLPFPVPWRNEGPAVGLPATPCLFCMERGALQSFSKPLLPTGMIQALSLCRIISAQGKLGGHLQTALPTHAQAMKPSIQANHSTYIVYVNLLPDEIKQNNKAIYSTGGMKSFVASLARHPGRDKGNPCYLHLGSSVPVWLVLCFLFFGISLPKDNVTGTQPTEFICLCC